MSLDLDSIRNKLNSLQKSTSKKSDFIWKPETGKNQIRIVPYQFNKENPFIEGYFHYNLGRKTYLSPQTYGESDPIVEFSEQLKSTGVKEDWQLGRKLEPKMRIYVPVLVRGKENEGVKLWGFGKTVYQELLNYIVDPDYGDITDLKNGRDVVVTYVPAEGANYPKTSIMIKPNPTPATEDRAVADMVLNQQSDFFDVFEKRSYDELKNALEMYINQDEVVDEQVQSETQETSSVTKTDDLDSAFDDLFNS